MSVKSRREEHTAATRAGLVEAGKNLFTRKGFPSTSIDDIAEAARVSKGAVYHHFRDKAELFEAIFRAEQRQLLERVLGSAPTNAEPLEALLGMLDAYIDGCMASSEHRALLQQAGGALGVDRCRAIDEAMALPVLRQGLGPLIEQGVMVDLPLEMLVRVLFSAMCEAAMTAVESKDDPRAARGDASRVLRALVSGLRAAPKEGSVRSRKSRRSR